MGNLIHADGTLATEESVMALITAEKLSVNHVRDMAGSRGTSVHDALEAWAEKGILPRVEVYHPDEQGYVQGLLNFLIDSGVEPVAWEVMVGSMKHKYAGRFDLRGKIPNGANVVVSALTQAGEPRKRGPKRDRLKGGEWLLDLKTSKGVYVSHFLQLEGYEGASVEDGYEPTVARGVVHVTRDGLYELVESPATFEDYLTVREAHRALTNLKRRKTAS